MTRKVKIKRAFSKPFYVEFEGRGRVLAKRCDTCQKLFPLKSGFEKISRTKYEDTCKTCVAEGRECTTEVELLKDALEDAKRDVKSGRDPFADYDVYDYE